MARSIDSANKTSTALPRSRINSRVANTWNPKTEWPSSFAGRFAICESANSLRCSSTTHHALRQVEEAQFNLRFTTEPDSNATAICCKLQVCSPRKQFNIELDTMKVAASNCLWNWRLQLDEGGVAQRTRKSGVADGESTRLRQRFRRTADPSGRDDVQPSPHLIPIGPTASPSTNNHFPPPTTPRRDVERPALLLEQTK
jgi:hypothetical protein